MADIRSAQALLEELPKNDAHKLVMELTEWIESVAAQTDFKLDHQFAVLRMLDEAVQPYARRLAREYFTPQELGRFQENRLWLALGNLHSHLASGYAVLFDRYCAGDKSAGVFKAHLPLIAGRMLHAMAASLKYVCARYGPIDNTVWSNLARFYRHAEQEQYLDSGFLMYPGSSREVTLRSCAGHLLGWHGCGVGTLAPLNIHLVERIVSQHASLIRVDAAQSANSLFSFDLDRPAPPMRVKVDAKAQASMRFIDMSAILPKLEELLALLGRNVVPDELNLGGTYDADLVREAAQHLADYLNAPPLRRSVRREIRVSMYVANGFAKVVEHADTEPGFSKELPSYWEVEDISATGFRTILPEQGGFDIRIGSLLGVQPDGRAQWGVAVVRRLMRDDKNQLHVGAEMLSNHVDSVVLGQGRGGADGAQSGVWLHAKEGAPSGEVRLLMKAGTFSAQRSLQASLNGKSYLLMPNGLQEKGTDYDLAGFRVIEQESGSDESY